MRIQGDRDKETQKERKANRGRSREQHRGDQRPWETKTCGAGRTGNIPKPECGGRCLSTLRMRLARARSEHHTCWMEPSVSVYFSSVCWISRRQQHRLSYSVILGWERGGEADVGVSGAAPHPWACPARPCAPTHRHGYRLRAHEVLVDLVALRLLVLHAVVQVLILLHRVAAGRGVRRSGEAPGPGAFRHPRGRPGPLRPPPPRAGPCLLRPPGQDHGLRHSLDLVGQSTVDVFITHTLLSGEGPGGATWCEHRPRGPGGQGASRRRIRAQPGPELSALLVTHMIPLFWAIGVQDRADRV